MSRVPLAWKNLTHNRRKLAVAILGISFAVMLMFIQRGFNNALFDSTVALLRQLDGDIVILHSDRFSLTTEKRFDRDVLDIASSSPDVRAVDPVFLENSTAFLRKAGKRARPIRVIGFDPRRPILRDDKGKIIPTEKTVPLGTAIMDVLSKRQYGFDLKPKPDAKQEGELANQAIKIVGTFRLGRDFANDGNLLMSDRSIAHYFPYRKIGDPLGVVDLGLVHCDPGADLEKVKDALSRGLQGRSVVVKTRQDFINDEIVFWAKSTPIGVIFLIGAIMGFIVGVITCYQVLATDVSDHLGELATLKAMGYPNSFFFKLIIAESLYLSVLGFVPGLLFSLLLFKVSTSFTGLIMLMTGPRAMLIMGLTVVMCVVSGILALRKLLSADPASLF